VYINLYLFISPKCLILAIMIDNMNTSVMISGVIVYIELAKYTVADGYRFSKAYREITGCIVSWVMKCVQRKLGMTLFMTEPKSSL